MKGPLLQGLPSLGLVCLSYGYVQPKTSPDRGSDNVSLVVCRLTIMHVSIEIYIEISINLRLWSCTKLSPSLAETVSADLGDSCMLHNGPMLLAAWPPAQWYCVQSRGTAWAKCLIRCVPQHCDKDALLSLDDRAVIRVL